MEGTREVHDSVMMLELATKSKKNCKIRDGKKNFGNQRQEWEMFDRVLR